MKRLGFILGTLLALASIAGAQAWNFVDVSSILTGEQPTCAGTMAWGDMDNDGDLDLFVGGTGGNSSYLYVNVNGELMEVSELYGLRAFSTEYVRKAEWVDFNSDGRLDLSLVKENDWGVQLLTQQINGQFNSRRAVNSQVFAQPLQEALWVDVDGNGTLDLVVSSGLVSAPEMTVFVREADDFVAMRESPFEELLPDVGAMTFCDYDNDRDLDVFLGNAAATGGSPHFFRNIGNGDYEDLAGPFGFPQALGATGAVWADFNNDSKLDLFVPDLAGTPYLYRGAVMQGGLPSLRTTDAPGLTDVALHARFAHAVDANLDGWTDLFLVRANGEGTSLMINVAGQYWYDAAPQLLLTHEHFDNRAGAWGDYDNDGDLDFAVALGSEGIRLFRNDLTTARTRITLSLVSRGMQTPLYGCNVRAQINGQLSAMSNGPVLCSSGCDDPRVTIVLNDRRHKVKTLDIAIRWPNGIERHYDLSDVTLNGIATLVEPVTPVDPIKSGPETLTTVPIRISAVASPNPFNPTTTVSFTLPEASDVRMEVYNLVGQKVAMLAEGPYAAGTHRVSFDGRNLPSGLYFSRLTAGNTTTLCRMLLAK